MPALAARLGRLRPGEVLPALLPRRLSRALVLPNAFEPRLYQSRYMNYFDDGGKRAVAIWHRRAGKDLADMHQTAKMAHERVGAYWHFLPTAAHARRTLWEARDREGRRLIDWAFPPSVVRRKNESEMYVEFKNGSLWRLMGSDQSEFVGAGPVKVTFSEYALCRPTVWDLVRPMLRENNGAAAFITTPRGRNHAWDIYETARGNAGWYSDLQTVKDTRLKFASNVHPELQLGWEEMVAEERAEGMEEALVRQEYFCDFSAANVGAIWGSLVSLVEQEGGLQAFEHERDGVCTSWDLGISDSTAIWFWRAVDGGVDVVDYYEAHGRPMSHYFGVLEERAERLGFRYLRHWLPHDARSRTLVTGTSILDEFLNFCASHKRQGSDPMGAVSVVPSLSLVDGIQAGRRLLQRKIRIHPRCDEEKGVAALRQYQYEYDEDAKTFSSKPLHDWSSHGADAFRMAAVVALLEEKARPKPKERKPLPQRLVSGADKSVNLDELWKQHRRDSRRDRRR